jgi:hypothetical protein
MTEPTHKKLSRRDALKALGAALGATALTTLPPKWIKPALAVSELPQHGITSCSAPLGLSQTFNYTGAVQSFLVPIGVCSVTVTVDGAAGGVGAGSDSLMVGQGGRVIATLAVTPGETLSVYVGSQGADGINGCTGGWNGGPTGQNGLGIIGGGGGGNPERRRHS